MTRAQRRILLAAVAVAALMVVFPPWETFGGHYLGHALVTSPPGYSAPRPQGHDRDLPRPEPIARVSVSLLAVQFAALWISGGTAFLLLGRPRKERTGRQA